MQLTELQVASILVEMDREMFVSDSMAKVFREWRKTEHGKLITDLASEVHCQLEDAPEEQGMRVNIIAQIPVDDAIAYKLMKTGIDDE